MIQVFSSIDQLFVGFAIIFAQSTPSSLWIIIPYSQLVQLNITKIVFFFFFINLGVSQAHGEAQTNLQGEVQPTDRLSLRVFKWALKHRPISVLGDQDNCDLVSRSRWIEPETCWRLSPVSLPLDHNHPVTFWSLSIKKLPM